MAATAISRSTTSRSLTRVVMGTLIASVVFGMWTMMVEAIRHAGEGLVAGFFSPLEYIAAAVRGGFGNASFYPAGQLPTAEPVGILFGLMGHMMNAVILGLIFYWIASRLSQSRATLIVAGIAYSVLLFVVMEYAILPFADPVLLRVDSIGFLVGHLLYGIGLGLTVLWAGQAQPSPA
jgi:hypothetical protein